MHFYENSKLYPIIKKLSVVEIMYMYSSELDVNDMLLQESRILFLQPTLGYCCSKNMKSWMCMCVYDGYTTYHTSHVYSGTTLSRTPL